MSLARLDEPTVSPVPPARSRGLMMASQLRGLVPVFHDQAADALKLIHVGCHYDQTSGQPATGDQDVVGADRLSLAL